VGFARSTPHARRVILVNKVTPGARSFGRRTNSHTDRKDQTLRCCGTHNPLPSRASQGSKTDGRTEFVGSYCGMGAFCLEADLHGYVGGVL